jgi:hypothetical protein
MNICEMVSNRIKKGKPYQFKNVPCDLNISSLSGCRYLIKHKSGGAGCHAHIFNYNKYDCKGCQNTDSKEWKWVL